MKHAVEKGRTDDRYRDTRYTQRMKNKEKESCV